MAAFDEDCWDRLHFPLVSDSSWAACNFQGTRDGHVRGPGVVERPDRTYCGCRRQVEGFHAGDGNSRQASAHSGDHVIPVRPGPEAAKTGRLRSRRFWGRCYLAWSSERRIDGPEVAFG